jgi:hypothetical protein
LIAAFFANGAGVTGAGDELGAGGGGAGVVRGAEPPELPLQAASAMARAAVPASAVTRAVGFIRRLP